MSRLGLAWASQRVSAVSVRKQNPITIPCAFTTIDLHTCTCDRQLLLFTANREIYLPITIARKTIY